MSGTSRAAHSAHDTGNATSSAHPSPFRCAPRRRRFRSAARLPRFFRRLARRPPPALARLSLSHEIGMVPPDIGELMRGRDVLVD